MSTQARRLSTRLKRTTETSLMLLGRRRNKAPAVCVRLEIAADVGLAPGAISSVKIPKYQYVGFNLSLSTRRGKRRRGDWIGGSSGRTSSSDRVADRCKAAATFAGDFSVSDRAHGSCRAGADYSGLFGRPVGLRRGARDRGDAADGDTLSRASRRIGGDRGAGRSAACGTRSGYDRRSEDLAGGIGVPEGQGIGLSPRAVDHSATRRTRSPARTDRRASEPGEAGPGNGLQDPGRARDQAAQGALLP